MIKWPGRASLYTPLHRPPGHQWISSEICQTYTWKCIGVIPRRGREHARLGKWESYPSICLPRSTPFCPLPSLPCSSPNLPRTTQNQSPPASNLLCWRLGPSPQDAWSFWSFVPVALTCRTAVQHLHHCSGSHSSRSQDPPLKCKTGLGH